MEGHRINPSRTGGAIVAVVIVLTALILGWQHLRRADLNPLSQEAEITATVVTISANISGRIATLHVSENDAVEKGDVLFTIEKVPYELAVRQADGDLAIAEAALADQTRAVRANESNAAVAAAQVARAEQNLALATNTLDRLLPLRPKGYVSEQEVDTAATAKRDAEITLREAQRELEAAEALVGDVEAAAALVEAREAALDIAKLALDNTVVRAPHDGRVVGLTTGVGEFLLPGQTVFTLIDTSGWYARASFVETELGRISVGQCATVYALADRTTVIRGRVDGIGWGITSTQVVDLPSALPFVPRSLDWVRVAQRYPVRIRLDDPPERLMRIGASATVTVHNGTDC